MKSRAPKVKICGITNLRDAKGALRAGADLLGFVFYKKSPRAVTTQTARRIIARLPKKIIKVGVFVNEDKERVKAIAAECRLDYLQFHGDETPAYLRAFRGQRLIKAVRLKNKASLKALRRYAVVFFLFDAYQKGFYGGTGERFNWELLRSPELKKMKFFVSGGLTPENVGELLAVCRPFALDVSSGVEFRPGKKDHRRMRKFVEAVHGSKKK